MAFVRSRLILGAATSLLCGASWAAGCSNPPGSDSPGDGGASTESGTIAGDGSGGNQDLGDAGDNGSSDGGGAGNSDATSPPPCVAPPINLVTCPVGSPVMMGNASGSLFSMSYADGGDAAVPPSLLLTFDAGESASTALTWMLRDTEDLSKTGALGLTLENRGTTDIRFSLELLLSDGGTIPVDGFGGLGVSAAGSTQTFALSATNSVPLLMQALPQYAACIPTLETKGVPDAGFGTAVTGIKISWSPNPGPTSILLSNPVTWSAAQTFDGLIDEFGQYTGRTWCGKATSTADLQAQAADEAKTLDFDAGPGDSLDIYGGTKLITLPPTSNTGYFHIEQRAAEGGTGSWLVDPLGDVFYSIGMVSVLGHDSAGGDTQLRGRNNMFTLFPDGGPIPGDGGPYTIDFIEANAEKKYGVDDAVPTLLDLSLVRLRSWGFNTVGAFSSPDYATAPQNFTAHRVPYTIYTRTVSYEDASADPGTGSWLLPSGMPDPFDTRFQPALDSNVSAYATAAHDPYLVGYFVDNELPWATPGGACSTGSVECFGLSSEVLSTPSSARTAFLDALQGMGTNYAGTTYANITALNTAWHTGYGSFSEVAFPSTPTQLAAATPDLESLSAYFTDKYFKTVHAVLNNHDPHHMYLGTKFHQVNYSYQALASAAAYADVLSFDMYTPSLQPNSQFTTKFPNKAAIVSEYSFGAGDQGMFWGSWYVGSQTTRAAAYQSFLASALANHQFVGIHWFQLYDEPALGRVGGGGENTNYGFLTVADNPYPELVKAAQTANAAVYGTLAAQ